MPYRDYEKSKKYNRAYCKRRYEANKEEYLRRGKQFKLRFKEWFRDLKTGLKCKECGENTPVCLDFHHRDVSKKLGFVSVMVAQNVAKKRILAEIEKCDVLCANCHRKRHEEERKGTVV